MNETVALTTIMGLIPTIGVGGLFLYIRGIKTDVQDVKVDIKAVARDLTEFKNGHYKQHMEDAYKKGLMEGTTKQTLEALHDRLDALIKA